MAFMANLSLPTISNFFDIPFDRKYEGTRDLPVALVITFF